MPNRFFEQTKDGLIVSCQALPEEPLHSSFIMMRMARAALQGGACGIRANSVEDIKAIRAEVALPMIGIIKKVTPGNPVFITPTLQEVDALAALDIEVIAMDATSRLRADGSTIRTLFPEIRQKYPNQLFMADCATFEDGLLAKQLGFDIIGTTLCGYTEETMGQELPSYSLIRRFIGELDTPVIAEGGIWSPETLAKVMATPGIHAAVVGSAITRPMEITRRYVEAIEG